MTDEFDRLPIDLARAPDFSLGALRVSPSAREVSRGDWRETLEPRVMQVLVALHQAEGAVVSRDDLIARCWEGRIVGEDAINRAIGRLRRLSEADSGASFEIETIAKVGYRLVPAVSRAAAAAPALAAPAVTRTFPRRTAIVATAAAVLGTVALVEFFKPPPPRPPQARSEDDADGLVARGIATLRRGAPESTAEALGLMQQAVTQAPNNADAWGGLALAYDFAFHSSSPKTAIAMRLRASDAMARAFAIDPKNALAWQAKGWAYPWSGHWLEKEKILRTGLAYHPGHSGLLLTLAMHMAMVGRNREAAGLNRRAAANMQALDPATSWTGIQMLWSAGRLPEADQLIEAAMRLYPRHTSVWFSKLYVLMFTGRLDEAQAMLADIDGRPPGAPIAEFDGIALVARAMQSRSSGDVDRAAASQLDWARKGVGYGENAMQFLSALRRVDDAYRVAAATYLGRGFAVAPTRFSEEQANFAAPSDRRAWPLFEPSTRAMRKDARFAPLMDALGISAYWKQAGVKPDYQVYPE